MKRWKKVESSPAARRPDRRKCCAMYSAARSSSCVPSPRPLRSSLARNRIGSRNSSAENCGAACFAEARAKPPRPAAAPRAVTKIRRSEEHTSELQSLAYLVCRLLLEKKKKHVTSSHFDDNA